MTLDEAKHKLQGYDQLHVLKYFDELTNAEKEELLKQIEETDFEPICEKKTDKAEREITPIDAYTIEDIAKNAKEYEELGLAAIKEGEAGAVLLAGGMGTRLGCDGPKGIYNIGITKELYIFECLINNLLEVTDKAGRYIQLFIMTSDKNHESTVSFLKEKNFFGYPERFV
ncbi:MAG: UTP--glucose-1-phosphate uridylyltransferase, partial [Lachnospiraceae bacterium]|nr:UTP--glucose-1-phosphate uridylyltransferase [Lachnospiraceae bacterium]